MLKLNNLKDINSILINLKPKLKKEWMILCLMNNLMI